jgi:cytochrome d ubiquinol oxidase subunit II
MSSRALGAAPVERDCRRGAIGGFPNLVRGTDASTSLSIQNAPSPDGTLTTMLVIAGIGIPLVLAYTISIYWIFRGKVTLDSMSY